MDVLALLARAEQAGLSISLQGDQLSISGPRSAAPLAAEIGRHRAAVLAHLQTQNSADTDSTPDLSGDRGVLSADPTQNWLTRHRVGTGRVVYFDPEHHDGSPLDWREPSPTPRVVEASLGWLGDWALLLDADDLPDNLSLGPWQTIIDRAKYLTWLQADVRRGPSGTRTRSGVLQQELRELHVALVGTANTSSSET